jgi:hypothetical protein
MYILMAIVALVLLWRFVFSKNDGRRRRDRDRGGDRHRYSAYGDGDDDEDSGPSTRFFGGNGMDPRPDGLRRVRGSSSGVNSIRNASSATNYDSCSDGDGSIVDFVRSD